jgi:hypothetical protein
LTGEALVRSSLLSVLSKVRLRLIGFAKAVLGQWLFVGTVLILIAAVLIWRSARSPTDATQLAEYVSGFASAITLVWLAAGLKIQAAELSLQRQELRLQRIASQQQAREIANSAKLSSLGQIRSLLDEAERVVRESPLGLSNITEIPSAFLQGMEHWSEVEKNPNPQAVIAAYQRWLPIESVARNYVRHIAAAMRLYIEYHHPDQNLPSDKEAEDFVYIYSSWVYQAPFLSHHIGPAALLAQEIFILKPGLDRMRLAWLVASAKSIGKNMMKEGSLEELRDNVLKRSETLPAVCTPWPK